MIDKNLKNQYKSIKAPADLKDRILEATEATAPVSSKKRAYKYAQLIAACLVAVLCIGFVGAGLTSSSVYVDGNIFYGEAISVEKVSQHSVSRAAFNVGQLIEIDTRLETKISLSNGEFTLTDCETGAHVYTGNEYSVNGKVNFKVDLPDGESGVLTLKNILSEREITLKSTEF